MRAPPYTLLWELDVHGAELAAVDEEFLGEALGDLVVAWLAALRSLRRSPQIRPLSAAATYMAVMA